MSEHQLPENPKHWPDDPFELLGVQPGGDARELKRAYTRLIRQYKPEQYPDQFRRIRDAYEHAQRFGAFFASLPEAAEGSETQPGSREPEKSDITSDFHAEPPAAPPPRAPRLEEELDQLWHLACSGQEAEAYPRLASLQRLHPNRVEIYVRLYWLLVTVPALDESRPRCDWLVRGLQASNSPGLVPELYRREILERPQEALTERFTAYFHSASAKAHLLQLADWRWHAASRLQRWAILVEDIDYFRDRLHLEDDELWARMLLSALDYLAWADSLEWAGHAQKLYKEVEALTHLANRLNYELDRLDFLRSMTEGWHDLCKRNVPPILKDLFPPTWTRPFEELRGPFLAFLTAVNQEPNRWLGNLDQIQECSSTLVAHLARLFDQFASERESAGEPDKDELRQPIFLFLHSIGRLPYPKLRWKIAEFCRREALAVEVFAEVIATEPEYFLTNDRHLAGAILEDWPLRYLCQAWLLFWQ